MSSIDSSKPTIRRPCYPLSVNAFLGPAFNACVDSQNSDQLNVDPALLRYSRAPGIASSSEAFLSPSSDSSLQHLYPSSISSPFSSIENLATPLSRSLTPSPPAFRTPVKVREQLEEDVLVMDGFMVNAVAGNRTRSSLESTSSHTLSANILYKTEICRSWEDTGSCRYGSKCQFAHGKEELRPPVRHLKHKSEICKPFALTGSCIYGSKCRFTHHPPMTAIAEQEENYISTARSATPEEGSMSSPGDESLEAFMDDIGIGVSNTTSSKEDEALMYRIVRGPRRPRLPVFTKICPD